jgi:cytochrome c oxidase subunit 3
MRTHKLEQSGNWWERLLPSGQGDRAQERGIFGFTTFLLSETMVFASFFVAYLYLRHQTTNWLPPGVPRMELTRPAINTAVLLGSSFVIYFAEHALKHHQIQKFRWLWLTTSVMGTFFLVGQMQEWKGLSFGLNTGLFGATFYLLTGFHGLHVFTGICLQFIMFIRSFIPGNYRIGHFGVTVTALFWHFVDIIWIILFSLLYLWQA